MQSTETEIHERLNLHRNERSFNNESFARDVLTGFSADQKFLPPKYFYDDYGSKLFEQITATKEYYPTRAEASILKSQAPQLATMQGCWDVIVELGSGNSEKTRHILSSFHAKRDALHYVPIDVSDILIESSAALLDEFSKLTIDGVVADYIGGMSFVCKNIEGRKLFLFLGSSIGNFNPDQAFNFLKAIRKNLNQNDALLIGFDLVKSDQILNAAYNDQQGVTRDFNLNVLRRINAELGGEFDLESFRHHAFFNREQSRVEMHLVSKIEQDVWIEDVRRSFHFNAGESIHTENSYKFTPEQFETMAAKAGFTMRQFWTDENDYFGLALFA